MYAGSMDCIWVLVLLLVLLLMLLLGLLVVLQLECLGMMSCLCEGMGLLYEKKDVLRVFIRNWMIHATQVALDTFEKFQHG